MRTLFDDKDIRKASFNDYGFKKNDKRKVARKSRRIRKQYIKRFYL